MAVTVHPPLTASNAESIVDARGVAWSINMGALDIVDEGRVVIATFAPNAWSWVELT